MASFPSVTVTNEIDVKPEFKTLISTFETGNEQRRNKWQFPKFNILVNFNYIIKSDVDLIYNFYMLMKGSYTAFYFFLPYSQTITGLYVGVGDGTTTDFDLPGKSTSSRSIYINGVEEETGFHFHAATGDGGADVINFDTAPGAGDVITCDFTGYQRIRCRFKEDTLTRKSYNSNVYSVSFELKGVHGN